jgi:hypothetical protein
MGKSGNIAEYVFATSFARINGVARRAGLLSFCRKALIRRRAVA